MKLKAYLGVALLGLSGSALGASVTLEWTPPDSYEDGSPINPIDLAYYTLYAGETSGDYAGVTFYPLDTQWVSLDLPSGTYYFALTVTSLAGEESELSNEVVRVVQNKRPKKPTLR